MTAARSSSSMAPCAVPLMVPRIQVRRVRPRHLASTVGEARFLALFGAERLDHGVAADRVGQRAAELGVPAVGEPRGRRDVAERQRHGQRDVDDRAGRDDQRPSPARTSRAAASSRPA